MSWAEYQKERTDDWIAMVQAGATLDECGRKYGVSRQRVEQVLKQEDIRVSVFRAARKAERLNQPITCRRCGRTYTLATRKEHFVAGNHRWKTYKRNAATIVKDAEIAEDYESGLTYAEITAKHHVMQTRVVRALRWNGLDTHRREQQRLPTMAESHARWDAVVADWQSETLFNDEIAAKYGISTSMVGLILNKRGLRPIRGEAQRRVARIGKWQRRHRR